MTASKKLTLTDCLMLIMGSMIGSGIFIVPAAMSRELHDPGLLLAAWMVTAILTFMAALCYAELGAMLPKAGGQYVYLKEAYHPLMGFLYGWTFFTVIQTGTIAAVGVAFAKFTGVFVPFISETQIIFHIADIPVHSVQLLAISIIWILTLFNFNSVKKGALLQNIFTFTKIGAIVFLILAGVWYLFTHDIQEVTYEFSNNYIGLDFWSIFAVALVGSIFSSDAWNNITFTGGEIENPKRNLPLSLLLGTGIVLLLYLLINWIYVQVLPFHLVQTAESDRVGTLLLHTIVGQSGLYLMALLIMVSTFGCMNGLILSGARVYYAMASDRLFLPAAKQLNASGSPQYALIMQAVWTSMLTLSGSYSELLDYVVFAVLLFYIITVGGVLLLRYKWPNAERPYRTPLYPVLPILYMLAAGFICGALLIHKPAFSLRGLGIVLSGIPIYAWITQQIKRDPR